MHIDMTRKEAQLQYRIRHGNIASCIHVTTDDAEYTAIYMNDTPKVEAYRGNDMHRDVWHDLPIEVAAAIVRQFRAVFALSVDQRGAFIKTLDPVTILVTVADEMKKGGPYDAAAAMKR